MERHAGIDVSLVLSSLCVVDATGRFVREAEVPSRISQVGGLLAPAAAGGPAE